MSNETMQRVVYPLDLLRVEIENVIDEKLFKNELWKKVNKEFEEKGLDFRSLQLLLDGKRNISELTEYELIAIAKSSYEILSWKELNPKRYFGDNTLINYENYINTNIEKRITLLEFKNFKKINAFDAKGEISYKELYDYLNNILLIYDHESQRSPKYREIGSRTGKTHKLRIVNLDMKAVESIADAILEKKFEDSEIILNCEMIEGKSQKYEFVKKYKEIDFLGDIIIEPNYNIYDDDTTWVSIIDGYHRCMGIMMAMNRYYAEEGVWLEGNISVRLVRATKERAKRIVFQTFQRSADKLEWVKTLAEDDYTKFVDMLVTESKFLSIENTIDEAIVNNKMTAKSLLVDILKETDIAVNDLTVSVFKSKSIAKNFDLMFDLINKHEIQTNPYFVALLVYASYKCHNISEIVVFVDFLSKGDNNIEFMYKKIDNVKTILDGLDTILERVVKSE